MGKGLASLALTLFCALVTPHLAVAQAAISRIFRNVEVVTSEEGHRIEIGFERPLRYLRHSPQKKGRSLQIQFGNLDIGVGPGFGRLPRRESVPPPKPIASLVTEIKWDSPEGGLLDTVSIIEFRFASLVEYEVEPSSDSRSITVILKRPRVPFATASASTSKQLIEARRAIRDGDTDRAVLLLRKLLDTAGNNVSTAQEARELLGVVHERRNEQAHARAEYEAFLAKWPEAEGASRVRQRLQSMLEAATPGRSALRTRDQEPDALRPEFFGSTALTYSRTETIDDAAGGQVLDSSGIADVYATSRLRTDSLSLRGDVIGSYRYDFSNNRSGNDTRISRLMLTAGDANENLKFTFGRQSQSNGGVLGRFDGGQLAWRATDRITLSGVFGFPLLSSSALKVQTDLWMAGAAIDFERIVFDIGGQFFLIGQQYQGLTDRLAIGGELRYAQPGRFGLLFVDYDVYFKSLNTALLTGNVTFNDSTDVHILAETRGSPVLTLRNALIGQTRPDLKSLGQIFTDNQIEDLARDRTGRSYTGSLGLTHRLDRTLQVAGDITVSSYSSTKASGGVLEVPAVGPDVGVGLQLTRSDFPMTGGFTTASVRYYAGETSDLTSLQGSMRLPLRDRLWMIARLRTDYRKVQSATAQDEIALRPSLRFDWRVRSFVVDAEVGIDWTNGLGGSSAFDSTGYFAELALRWDFE